jgi:hypothetical protein
MLMTNHHMLICNIDHIETFQMKLVKRPLIFKGSRLQHPPKATLLQQILPLEMKDGSTIFYSTISYSLLAKGHTALDESIPLRSL